LESEDQIEVLNIDNAAVCKAQIGRIEQTKRQRDPKRVGAALAALGEAAANGKGNILAAAVDAARARATVGEISDTLRRVFGDHAAVPEVISKIYGSAFQDEPEYKTLASRIENVSASLGRRPKLMVAKLGQDGHDRGAKVIASAFGDLGFDVVAGPLFQTPEEAAAMAVASEVHVVGASSLVAGHKTLLPQLIEALKAKGAENIIVVCGGVVPRQDYQFLMDHGVAAVFGPGTQVLEAARAVVDLLEGRRRNH
ncbi:methylmalonyl-CoA mutase, partial [Mesorhizobium sp. M5C.F.Ca.IN.020.14.1.1]